MVAIVSGNSTGLNLASSSNLGQRGNLGSASQGKTGEQSIVNIATGNLILQDKDGFLAARGNDLSLVRTYNSQGTFTDDNADGWWINGYRRLVNVTGALNQPGSSIQRVGADNSVQTYDFDSVSNEYVARAGSGKFDTLKYDADTTNWTWTDPSTQSKESYTAHGDTWRLSASTDTNGNSATYAYTGDYLSAITSPNGDKVEFTYAGANLAQEKILLADGTVQSNTTYGYDAQNRLTQVKLDLTPEDNSITDGKVYVTSYSYVGNSNLITGVSQTDGTQLSFTYINLEGADRIASMTDALGRVTKFSYDLATRTTTVTDPLGNKNTYTYDSKQRFTQITGPAVDGVIQQVQYQYDAAGKLIQSTDAAGNSTINTYDSQGNLLSQTDSLGDRVERTYGEQHQVLTSTVYRTPASGNQAASLPETTRTIYDAHLNARFVVSAQGSVTEFRYNNLGQRIASISYPSASYNLTGLSTSQSLSQSQLETWVAAQSPAQTSRTDYQYNSRGQLTSMTSYNAVDTNGNGVADGKQSTSSYGYDAAGNLLFKIDADNNQTSYVYDGLGRVLSSTDALGHSTVNHYDDANHTITQTQANGRIDTAVYDAAGQLISVIAGGQAQSEYRYDALGRLSVSTDATGIKQLYIYDAAGHLQGQVDGDGKVTQYVYNALGQRIQTIQHSVALTTAQIGKLISNTDIVLPATTPATQPSSPNAATTSATPAAPATPSNPAAPAASSQPVSTPAWNIATAYLMGEQVAHSGKVYQARTDTQGSDPASNAVWLEVVPASSVAAWSETQYYLEGQTVTFEGQVYLARWDTAPGNTPGVDKVWTQVPAPGEIRPWMAGVEYVLNQTVTHDGQLWKANWTTIPGNQPGVDHVWSQVVPAGTNPPWSAGPEYVVGQIVIHAGQRWTPRWPTHADVPGETQVWAQAPEAGTYAPWGAGVTYIGGEIISHNGHLWLAQWFNKGETPGVEGSSAWAEQGVTPDTPPVTPPVTPTAPARVFYDLLPMLTSSANDLISRSFYDAAGRLSKTVSAAGAVTEYEYDGAGNLLATVQRATLINTATLTVNTLAQDIVVPSQANDRSATYFYDLNNQVTGTVDAEGYLSQYRYDSAGRRVEVIRFATKVNTTVTSSSNFASLIPSAHAADQHSYAIYDTKGQLVGNVDAEGYLTELRYDANGNALSSTRYINKAKGPVTASSTLASLRPAIHAEDQTNSQTYDALNRVISSTNAEGTQKQYEYDVAGNLVKVIDAAGTGDIRISNQRYDQLGRVIATLSGLGSSLLTGNQNQQEIDAIWAQYGTSYGYDTAGRRVSMTDPNGNKTLFYYDQSGNLTHTINALGEVQELKYNQLNQLVNTVQYGTRLSSLSGMNGGLADSNLRTAITSIANSALDSQTSISYNTAGQISSITDQLGAVTGFSYDAFGQRAVSTVGIDNDRILSQVASYDRRGAQVGTLTDMLGAAVVAQLEYDAFGRISRAVDGNGNERLVSYDRLGRAVGGTDASHTQRNISYDAIGRILSQTDGNSNAVTYTYDTANRGVTITTAEGVKVSSIHNRQGQTSSVTDGNGHVTSYQYDTNGNLRNSASELNSAGNVYDNANRLIQTTDANGNKVSYHYDAANRLLSRTVDANGLALTTSYQYDAKGQQIRMTDANGIVTLTNYDLKGQVISQIVDPTGLNAITRYSYDQRGKVLTVTSPAGNVVKYDYDALGRRIAEHTDPAGQNITRSYQYDDNNNVVAARDANGNLTRYVYDSSNRLVYTINASGAVQKNAYDNEGRVTTVINYATAISLTGLSEAATIAEVALRVRPDSLQDVQQSRVYDKDGHVRFSVDGTGSVTRYTYDANGNVTERISYAKEISLASWVPGTAPTVVPDSAHDQRVQTVYDALNRPVYVVSGTGTVTKTTYDANGNVVDVISYAKSLPAGTPVTASALATATAALADAAHDAHVHRSYDAANRLSWSVDANGAVTRLVYDKNGNLTKQVSYANSIAANAAAEAVQASDADRVTLMTYDDANRLSYQVNADGSVSHYIYDANGQLAQRIAYATTIAAPNANSQLGSSEIASQLQPDSTQDRNVRYTRDSAGRLLFTIDSQGAVSENRYDANGNLVGTISYAHTITTTNLPAVVSSAMVRDLLQADPANDHVQRQVYDASGRVLFSIDALGYVKGYSYDALGRLVKSTEYAKALPAITLNGSAPLDTSNAVPAQDAADQVQTYQYNADGRLIAHTDALNKTERFSYDGLGNRISYTNKLSITWTYDYDAAGRLLRETSPIVSMASVTLDAAGKLQIGATASAAVISRMTYDALGNLTSRTEAAGRPEQRITRFDYDALGRQTRTVYQATNVYDGAGDNLQVNGANSLAFASEKSVTLEASVSYDSFGNVIASRDVAGNYSYRTYDKQGRVNYDIDALGNVTGYSRNSFGNTTSVTRYASAINAATLSGQAGKAPVSSQVTTALAGVDHSQDRTTTSRYDQLGRAIETTEPATWINSGVAGEASVLASKVTRYSYDVFGNLSQSAVLSNPANDSWAVSRYFYDKQGQRTASINALGYVSFKTYDAQGNVSSSTEYANAGSVDANGKLVMPINSSDDRTTLFAYDKANRQLSQTRINVGFSDGTTDISTGQRSRGNVTTSVEYDALGNVISSTDALGNSSYRYYDVLGRLKAVAEPGTTTGSGATLITLTEYSHDAYGNVVTKRDYANSIASANSTTYAAGSTSSDDRISLARYDVRGNVIQNADANGINHFASYDAQNHLRKQWQAVTNADGSVHTLFTAYEYDALGRRTASITPGSNVQLSANGSQINTVNQNQAALVRNEVVYNAFDEIIRERSNGQEVARFDYDNAGHLWRTNSGGVTRVMQYDVQGRQTVSLSSAGISTASLNLGNGDPLANISTAHEADSVAGLRRNTTQYDALGRATTLSLPTRDGQTPVIRQSFDRWGNLTSRSDLNGYNGVTSFQYNANNQLIRQISPDAAGQQSANSAIVELYYDRLGRQIANRDANGNVNQMAYDASGQLIKETHADGGIVSHAYDNFGKQVQLTDANGNHTSYQYDKLGRLLQTTSDPVGVYGTETGNVTGKIQSLVSRTSYDEAGRVIAKTNANGETTKYGYDLRGNLILTTKPLGQYDQYAYDSQGNQIAHRDAIGNISTWQYNAQGQLQSHKDIGGATYTYRYDSAGQLLQQTNTRGQNLNYHYNEAGQVTQIRDLATDKTTLYSYNLAGKHTREQTIQADISLQNTRLSYNAQGQLSLIEALDDGYTSVLEYDQAGNLKHEVNIQTAQTAGTTTRQVSISGSSHTVSHETVQTNAIVHNNSYAYDSMQRQTLVEGTSTTADQSSLTASQGHLLTYDKNGNVASDTAWGKELVAQIPMGTNGQPDVSRTTYIVREGMITRYFTYDAANRVSKIAVASYDNQGKALPQYFATVVDERMYDGAGRLLQEGINDNLAAGYLQALQDVQKAAFAETATRKAHYYNANGWITKDLSYNVQGQTTQSSRYSNYDAAGHLRGYSTSDHAGNHVNVALDLILGEGYLQSQIKSTYTNGDWTTLNGWVTQQISYDVNGQKTQVKHEELFYNNTAVTSYKHQVTDARGQVLLSEQANTATTNLIVNGQVFNSWTGANHHNFMANNGNGTGKTDVWVEPPPAPAPAPAAQASAPTTSALFAARAMFSMMAVDDGSGESGGAEVIEVIDSNEMSMAVEEDSESFSPAPMMMRASANSVASTNSSLGIEYEIAKLQAEYDGLLGDLSYALNMLSRMHDSHPKDEVEQAKKMEENIANIRADMSRVYSEIQALQSGGEAQAPMPPGALPPVTSNDLYTLQSELAVRTGKLSSATTQLQQLMSSNPPNAATAIAAWQTYIAEMQSQIGSIQSQISALSGNGGTPTPPTPTTPTLPMPAALPPAVDSNDIGMLQAELNYRAGLLAQATTNLQQLTASNPTASTTLAAWQSYIDGLQAQISSINAKIAALQPATPTTPPAPAGSLAEATVASATMKTTTEATNAANASVTGNGVYAVNGYQNTLNMGTADAAQARTTVLNNSNAATRTDGAINISNPLINHSSLPAGFTGTIHNLGNANGAPYIQLPGGQWRFVGYDNPGGLSDEAWAVVRNDAIAQGWIPGNPFGYLQADGSYLELGPGGDPNASNADWMTGDFVAMNQVARIELGRPTDSVSKTKTNNSSSIDLSGIDKVNVPDVVDMLLGFNIAVADEGGSGSGGGSSGSGGGSSGDSSSNAPLISPSGKTPVGVGTNLPYMKIDFGFDQDKGATFKKVDVDKTRFFTLDLIAAMPSADVYETIVGGEIKYTLGYGGPTGYVVDTAKVSSVNYIANVMANQDTSNLSPLDLTKFGNNFAWLPEGTKISANDVNNVLSKLNNAMATPGMTLDEAFALRQAYLDVFTRGHVEGVLDASTLPDRIVQIGAMAAVTDGLSPNKVTPTTARASEKLDSTTSTKITYEWETSGDGPKNVADLERYKAQLAYDAKLQQHLRGPDGFTSEGVYGTHNDTNFLKAVDDYKLIILDIKYGENGLKTYTYIRPKTDNKGNFVHDADGNIEYRYQQSFDKTTYDSSVHSDSQMYSMAKQAYDAAARIASVKQNEPLMVKIDGVEFQVYFNNGVITNVHPMTK